jgi:uncharacterized protein YaiI (UPF0178 family)
MTSLPVPKPQTIWVDADACPGPAREILYRAAKRTRVNLILVANQPIRTPPSPNIRSLHVSSGFDVADNEIVSRVTTGDLVITSDIPLAAEIVAKGALGLSPRGELFTSDNVRARLQIRDFLETMRASGVHSGGPPSYSAADRKAFAAALDRWLSKMPPASTPQDPMPPS